MAQNSESKISGGGAQKQVVKLRGTKERRFGMVGGGLKRLQSFVVQKNGKQNFVGPTKGVQTYWGKRSRANFCTTKDRGAKLCGAKE